VLVEETEKSVLSTGTLVVLDRSTLRRGVNELERRETRDAVPARTSKVSRKDAGVENGWDALGSERLGVTLVGVEVSDLALFVAFRVSDVWEEWGGKGNGRKKEEKEGKKEGLTHPVIAVERLRNLSPHRLKALAVTAPRGEEGDESSLALAGNLAVYDREGINAGSRASPGSRPVEGLRRDGSGREKWRTSQNWREWGRSAIEGAVEERKEDQRRHSKVDRKKGRTENLASSRPA
jgi:hypothetical protein